MAHDKEKRTVRDVVGSSYEIVGSVPLADYLSRGFVEVKPAAPAKAAPAKK